ncbi:MAG: glycoside hydrolase family 71/99-like protein [Verrucomicrobiota bacterium]
MKRVLIKLAFGLIAGWTGISQSSGASADLVPLSVSDGICAQTTVAGQSVWQNTGNSSFLYFRRPNNFAFTVGQTLYVRATYYDEGGGRVGMQYDGQAGAFTQPFVHTRTSRVDTGKFVDGYFELKAVNFARRENGETDFRLICGAPGGIPVSVQKVTLQDVPFSDPDFLLAVSRPWMTRYTGAARDYVDNTTLKDKVMVGYQGWFRTPNDLDDNGWFHWCGNDTMSPANFNTDMWPELTEYDPATLHRAGNVVTRNGQPAYVFSSTSLAVVRTHFRWMRKHNIDGAFVQRFGPQAGAQPEWVLRNISQAAAEEGITWAIEYDVSGMANSTVAAKLQADWEWLTTQFGLLDDPRYAHENGKPVVFIWGFPFADRGFTTPNANAAVDYFLSQGAYVIGGIPNIWTTLDAGWQAHILKYNGVLVWQNQGTSDGATFRNRGQDFFPHVWPGFSWANLTKTPAVPPTAFTDRNGGQFYWTLAWNWIQSGGADRLFVGMFDEYDEGTAIMPMSDDPPNPPAEYGRFIDNQGNPSDWWMMLTDELKRMMLHQRTITEALPTVASLANRSNIGDEATVDLGASDVASSLNFVDNGDGHTVVETVGGKESRGNTTPATDLYMYFNVANGFASQLPAGDITVEVEYFDAPTNTVLGLQYDSTTAAYKNHPQTITTSGSNRWRRVRFEISDAWLGGRQNGGADFRLTFGGKKLNVNRVWVRLPEEMTYAKWAGVRFGGNPDIAGKSADPDHDGVTNLLEYALSMDPMAPDTTGLPAVSLGSGSITFTYTRPATASDLNYQVQWSADLSTWSGVGITEEIQSDNGTLRSVEATIPLGDTKRFLRLRVTGE